MAGAAVFSGDFSKLRELVSNLRELNKGMIRDAHRHLAEEALSQVHGSFANGVDPYGASWLPIHYRVGQPLRDKGRLMNSQHYRLTDRGFVIQSNLIYAAIHQYGGTVRKPPQTNFHKEKGKNRGRFVKAGRSSKTSISPARDVTIPARSWLPLPSRGLGPRWTRAFTDVMLALRRQRLGR